MDAGEPTMDDLLTLLSRRLEGRWELVAEDEGRRLLVRPSGAGAGAGVSAATLAQALETLLTAAAPPGEPRVQVRAEGVPVEYDEEAGLLEAARALARTAAQLGRAFALGPMSVQQRRAVHQALGEVPEVWTQSEGDGLQRRLWLVPRQIGRRPEPGRGAGEPRPAAGAKTEPAGE